MKKNNFISLLIGSYYSIFFIGMYYITRGLLLPQIQKHYNIDNTTSGLIYLIPVIPCLITQLLSGYILEVLNKQKILLFSAILLFSSSLALPLSNSFGMFLLFSIISSLSIVLCGTGSSVAIIDTFEKRYPKYKNNGLSFYHFSYSLGAVLSLLFMTLYAKDINNWQYPLLLIALSGIIMVFSFVVTKYPQKEKIYHKKSFSKARYFQILKNPLMIKYALLSLLYAGIEGGIANWIAVFIENGYSESKSYSSLIFLLFFAFLSLGRMFGAMIIHKFNKYLILNVFLFIELFCMIMAFGYRVKFYNFDIFIPLCGLFLSIVFPTFQSFLADDFKDDLGPSNSIFFAGNMIGGTILVFLIGFANDLFGEKLGLLTTALYISLMIPLYFSVSKQGSINNYSQISEGAFELE
jgi:fucose permease